MRYIRRRSDHLRWGPHRRFTGHDRRYHGPRARSVILATRIFLNYFTVEILFGVKDHFGKGTDEAVREQAPPRH